MKRWKRIFLSTFILVVAYQLGFSQKIGKEFRAFYTGFQRNVEAGHSAALKQIAYFPFQTIYWIDGVNTFSDEEKADGLIQAEDFDQYNTRIFNADVRRMIPEMDVTRVQQIDLEASGDYYKQLGKLVDSGTTLLELYCQYGEDGSIGEHYFAFVFGRVNSEYRILAYYTNERVK